MKRAAHVKHGCVHKAAPGGCGTTYYLCGCGAATRVRCGNDAYASAVADDHRNHPLPGADTMSAFREGWLRAGGAWEDLR